MRGKLKKAWGFLARTLSKEFWVFLFFLLLSAAFWVLQTLDEDLTLDVEVPVKLVDVPNDVVITTAPPSKLKVQLKDKGTSLLHFWRGDVDTLEISFADFENASSSGRVRIFSSEIQKRLQSVLAGSNKITNISPDTIEFYFNHGLHKVVPVKIDGVITTADHYYLVDSRPVPSQVTVYASSAVLDTLQAVYTVPLNMSGLTESQTSDVKLRKIKGAKFSKTQVSVSATVDVFMENQIEVTIGSSNFPAGKTLRTFPSTVQVTYTTGYLNNKNVKTEDFVILFTYDQILQFQEQGNTKIPLKLKNTPKGVTNVRIEPQEVDYLIENTDSEE